MASDCILAGICYGTFGHFFCFMAMSFRRNIKRQTLSCLPFRLKASCYYLKTHYVVMSVLFGQTARVGTAFDAALLEFLALVEGV